MTNYNNDENSMIFDAASNLVDMIMRADEDEIDDLNDYVGSGFPISISVEFGEDGRVEAIDTEIGHFDGFEWHGTGHSIELLRTQKHNLLSMMTEHVETAIDNHRDVLEAA